MRLLLSVFFVVSVLLSGCSEISSQSQLSMDAPSTVITQKDLAGHRPVYSQITADPNFAINHQISGKYQPNLTQAPDVL